MWSIITVLASVVWLLLVEAKLSRHQLWSVMIWSEPNQFQLQKIVCFQLWRRSRAIYRDYLNEICAAGTILLECSVQRSVSVTIKILNDVTPDSAQCCNAARCLLAVSLELLQQRCCVIINYVWWDWLYEVGAITLKLKHINCYFMAKTFMF